MRLVAPLLMARTDAPNLLSGLARLVASGTAETKPELVAATGLARSTVTSHVDTLVRRGVLATTGMKVTEGRGRPADRLGLAKKAGLIVAVDIGARHTRLAVAELGQHCLANSSRRLDVRDGPESTLRVINEDLDKMLADVGANIPVRCVVVGVPARVDSSTGCPVRPNIMPGWDAYPVAHTVGRHLGSPAILENDTNLRAIGEAAALGDDQRPIIAVKVATGVGAGIVDAHGDLFHGFDGAAGDVGHIPVRRAPALLCTCGTLGCVEVVASIPSIVKTLRDEHPVLIDDDLDDLDQLLDLLGRGDAATIHVVRGAAEALGEAVAIMCNLLNPRRIVMCGELATATDEILAGVRAIVYQTARPQATRNLVISHSVLGEMAGIAGALVLGIESALSPASLARWHGTSALGTSR